MFRKDIEAVYKTVFDANEIVQTLLTDDMKMELNEQVFFLPVLPGIQIRSLSKFGSRALYHERRRF